MYLDTEDAMHVKKCANVSVKKIPLKITLNIAISTYKTRLLKSVRRKYSMNLTPATSLIKLHSYTTYQNSISSYYRRARHKSCQRNIRTYYSLQSNIRRVSICFQFYRLCIITYSLFYNSIMNL